MALFPRPSGPRLYVPRGTEYNEDGVKPPVLLPSPQALAAARRLERGRRVFHPKRVQMGSSFYRVHVDGTVYLELPHSQVKIAEDAVKEAVYRAASGGGRS